MDKAGIARALRRDLEAAASQRRAGNGDPAARLARTALKTFQSTRMAATHADLLTAPGSSAAARFFLDDLYGVQDLTRRDADLARIIPMMERVLPFPALATIAEAMALDALSESLDASMAARLGPDFTEDEYAEAYRQVGARADRERQIAHVRSVGMALSELVRLPLIGGTLLMMRTPAKLARLSELHDFLERGYGAFSKLKQPGSFVDTIVARESTISRRLYAGQERPFDIAV